jgi:hypothetical protein
MSDPESSGGEPVKDVAPKRVKPQDVISKRDLTRSVMGLFNTSECPRSFVFLFRGGVCAVFRVFV